MRNILSIILATMLIGAAVPESVSAANKCQAQQNAQKNAATKDKAADKAVSNQERNIESLTRQVNSNTIRVDNLKAQQEREFIKIREKGERDIDKQENKRLDLTAKASELTLQATQCAGADIINGLLGTEVSCNSNTRDQLLAKASQFLVEAGRIQAIIESTRDRARRKADSKKKSYQPKIDAAQQKLDRSKAALAAAIARLPELQAKAEQTQKVLDAANLAVTVCLGQ